MSVNRPLGATQGGAFELQPPALDTRTSERTRLGHLGLAGILITGLLVSISAASTGALLPQPVQVGITLTGLAGAFGSTGIDLGTAGASAVLIVMFVSYLVAVRAADRLSPLLVLGAIAALHALMLLAPPLFSTDVFSYQFYGRMGALYGANPYLAGPHAFVLDPLYPYVGSKWWNTPTVYGPIFTAFSSLLAPLSIPFNVVAYKAIAALSSLATVALVWNAARLRGVDPVKAAALVGLNPLIVVFGVGGGHNDLLMLAVAVAGLVLLMQRRSRAGAGAIVVGAGIKVTAGLFLPFALADARGALARTRRREILIGAGVASAVLLAFAFALFGSGPSHLPGTIQKVQSEGNWQSIPGFLGTRLGLGTVSHPVALVLTGLFALAVCLLLRQVWRGELDWVAGAGWAALALLVTAASLLPWYLAWLMPLAALGRDSRLWRASLALTGVMLGLQLLAYIPHASTALGL
jgi:Glycosyltransferase family 87